MSDSAPGEQPAAQPGRAGDNAAPTAADNSATVLGPLLARARAMFLDFDGPVCSVFAGYPAPQVAEDMRTELLCHGMPLSEAGRGTGDPMKVLADAAKASPEGSRLAEKLLQAAELKCMPTAAPTPGAAELIQAVIDSGRLVLVVSNNSAPAIRNYLELHGLDHLVHAVIGRDPQDATLMKPHPHLLQLALKAAGCAPNEAVFIGDSISDVTAGQAARVPVIGYANKPHKVECLANGTPAIVTRLQLVSETLNIFG